ncbi:lytic transglycosylase domain-containing protein [Photobacterium frigidiphilum]|nr:lytic transglycosylase domain-containing protein [Photobacterium frigidiphilum]
MRKILCLLAVLASTCQAKTDEDILYELITPMPAKSHPIISTNTEPSSKWQTSTWQQTKQQKASLPCPAYCEIINRYSQRYGIPDNLLMAQIQAESNFNPNAISHRGAKGLMQLMDVNSTRWNIDPFNPEQNIKAGSAHMARLLKKYQDVRIALAAYNAGEGAVKKYGGIPPYKETQEYIARIEKTLREI